MGKKKKFQKNPQTANISASKEKIELAANKHHSTLRWRFGILLSVIAFLLYSNTLHYGYVLDDGLVISENHTVQKGIAAIPEILRSNFLEGYYNGKSNLYRPFTLVLMAIEWQLFPNDPAAGHFISCLFYAGTAFLVFWLLTTFFTRNLVLSFLIGLLFVVHPIHTEVVANIKSADELMAFFFSVISFLAMMQYAELKKTRSLVIMAVAYFFALMFKESSMTLIAVFPLTLYFFTKARGKEYAKVMLFIIAVALIQIIMRTLVLNNQTGIDYAFLKIHNSLVGAEDFNEKSASIVMILGRYLALLFFPVSLSSDYAYNQIPLVRWDSLIAIVSFIVYIAMIVLVIFRFRKKEAWIFGVLFYLITMSLYSNIIVPVGATIGERFLYIPSFGFCIAVVCILETLLRKNRNIMAAFDVNRQGKQNTLLIIVVAFLSVLAGIKTFSRNKDWKDNLTLYAADIKTVPNSARMNYWYGNEIMIRKAKIEPDTSLRRKYYDTVLVYLGRAVEIYPEYGEAYAQRGLAYFRLAQNDNAKNDYLKAVEYKVAQWQVYNNLAVIYAQQNNLDSALKFFTYSLKVDNKNATVYKNIGNIYHVQKDYLNAVKRYNEALALTQTGDSTIKTEIYGHLADDYKMIGDTLQAAHYFELMRK